MTRTRVVFIVIIALTLIIVGVALYTQRAGKLPLVQSTQPLSVRIVCALPVEPFVREAAKQFNAEKHTLDGVPINVTVTPMDGLVALGRWERGEMDPLPTVWIPDSRYLVELVNATFKEQRGRDIFLTGGEYRARPIATSLFLLGHLAEPRPGVAAESSATRLRGKHIHDAATAPGGWPELGGKPEWGYFKLVVPNPRKNVGGLIGHGRRSRRVYQKTRIEVADVTDADIPAMAEGVDGRRDRLFEPR